MKQVITSNGKVVVVDDEDFALIGSVPWTACKPRKSKTFYAYGCVPGGKGKKIMMHRMIMAALPSQKIDHRDGDGLNNCRENMRFASDSQNASNRRSKSKTGYRGVALTPYGGFEAYIKINQKRIHLGTFYSAEIAAFVYNKNAIKLFGEFAILNPVGA